jgi:hypothetical protein
MPAAAPPVDVVLGPWLHDEPRYAAVTLLLPLYQARVTVSIVALDRSRAPVCSLLVQCRRGHRILESRKALRVQEWRSPTPDFAMFLSAHVRSDPFQRVVLQAFVARMQVCGMI